ncbi:hypothetical protein [Cecembia sp.]|uniref:hypothetical protein n=1 Tax=Cecembia sp. TaxID=1898110 RepID=UPI0025BBA2B1|nr:hypothetical protein [Cecembia sp.]
MLIPKANQPEGRFKVNCNASSTNKMAQRYTQGYSFAEEERTEPVCRTGRR